MDDRNALDAEGIPTSKARSRRRTWLAATLETWARSAPRTPLCTWREPESRPDAVAYACCDRREIVDELGVEVVAVAVARPEDR